MLRALLLHRHSSPFRVTPSIFSYPFGVGIFVKVLRPLQVGAVKATDGECKGKADEVKRREGEIADGEAGASHAAGLSL